MSSLKGADLKVVAEAEVQGEAVACPVVLGVDRKVMDRNAVKHRLPLGVLDRVGVRVVGIEGLVGVEVEPAGISADAVRREVDPVVVHPELDLVIAAHPLGEPGEVVLELPAGLRTHLVVAGAHPEGGPADVRFAQRQPLGVEVAGVPGTVAERLAHLVLGEGARWKRNSFREFVPVTEVTPKTSAFRGTAKSKPSIRLPPAVRFGRYSFSQAIRNQTEWSSVTWWLIRASHM